MANDGLGSGRHLGSTRFTLKELKSRLDENQLDLSMTNLTIVPVKELALVKKATVVDLSCNQLTELSEDFSSLTQLVRLDLSQNQLVSLPETFGNLTNLQHLDLYKNRLTTLPVSFCRLKQLKWLDLKDNPLTDDLRSVTGDCLDQKQCQQAAQKVVQFMQKVQSNQERERQRALQKQREEENAKRLLEEAKTREQHLYRKKEKERRKQEQRQRHVHNPTQTQRFAERVGETRKRDAQVKQLQKRSVFNRFLGCLGTVLGLLMLLVFVSGCLLLVGAFILYSNCSSRPEWIPNSKPLCHDLYHWSTTGAQPSLQNFHLALSGAAAAAANRTKELWDQIVAVDYRVWTSKAGEWVGRGYEKASTADYGQLVKESAEWFRNQSVALSLWCQEELGPRLRLSAASAKLTADWCWERAKLATRWLLDATFELTQWMILTSRHAIDNLPNFWERIKFYWNNMK